jgi:hypothetical protein
MLGMQTPKTYLVLALNEDEVRPGGGFITGVGEIRLDGGEIVSMDFADSYVADDFSQPYPEAPEPLWRFLGIELWVFRDSNWSPDFPTSARQAMELYRPGYEVQIDGVVALDQYAVQHLVAVLGPLTLPDVEEPVTHVSLLRYMRGAWAPDDGTLNREWWQQRKSFMGDLAKAALARLEGGDLDWYGLATTALTLVEEKHLQVFFEEPQVAERLAERGWSGELWTPEGDFLMVVEANLGYNKASARLQRRAEYMVDLTQFPPRAELTLIYTHTTQTDYPCTPEIRYDPSYEQMIDRCHWGYLRIYTPRGSELLEASRHFIPAESIWIGEPWEGEAHVLEDYPGYTVFEQAFLLAPGEETELRFVYALPQDALPQEVDGTWVYRLDWQKQAGLKTLPTEVVLNLPENVLWLATSIEPKEETTERLVYEWTVRKDEVLEVRYRVGE